MPNEQEVLSGIFTILYGNRDGYICVAAKNFSTGSFVQEFFQYPNEVNNAINFIEKRKHTYDLYFCPNLFTEKKRSRDYISVSTNVWADLDHCHPSKLEQEPTITTETSPGRFQAFWVLEEEIPVQEAQQISKRIAYGYHQYGADLSGHDPEQLLRVPYTYNYKYESSHKISMWRVKPQLAYKKDQFDSLPTVDLTEFGEFDFPDELPDVDQLLEEYRLLLTPIVYDLIESESPPKKRSTRLWQLELSLFESGMSREEVLAIADSAACNKYREDDRGIYALWKEVIRAYWTVHQRQEDSELHIPNIGIEDDLCDLLTEQERFDAKNRDDFISAYTLWARDLSDAAWQYHEAGAFVILSSLLSGAVKLPTSFGTILPNLWFMILADTTLTRKSTAMDIAMDLLMEVDPDAMLATDGSIEGMLEGLRSRPGRPSVFLRDEFTGLMEMVVKRDYYAGMLETLTKLYDGKRMKRILKRETIELTEPVLIMFAGGIKTKMNELVRTEHVTSGFIPRFLFITAEGDLTKMSPLGPPREIDSSRKDDLLLWMNNMNGHFWQHNKRKIAGKLRMTQSEFEVKLTPEAWNRYNEFEHKMMQDALNSDEAQNLTPTFARMAISGLKCAVLLAASESLDNDSASVVVEIEHLLRAFYFIEKWREHTMYVISNLNMSQNERVLQNVLAEIYRHPTNNSRSGIMKKFQLSSAKMDAMIRTLEERGHIKAKRTGKTYRYEPLDN